MERLYSPYSCQLHKRIAAYVAELNEIYAPLKVFSGVAITVKGMVDDFLVLGVHDIALKQRQWNYMDLVCFVRERNGYIALAHPFRYWEGINCNILIFRPDAMELYSGNLNKLDITTKRHILKLSNAFNIKIIANSDAHSTDEFCYCNMLKKTPANETELISMLKLFDYSFAVTPIIHKTDELKRTD